MAETPAEVKRPAASIVKLAIQSDGRQPLLYDFDQRQPLAAIVRSVCQRWDLTNPDRYAFKYMDSNTYITEKNRFELKNGVLLKIAVSPTIEAKESFQRLSNSNVEEARRTIRVLAVMSKDASYSTEFITCGGLTVLIAKIEEHANRLDDQLGPALGALQELVEQGGVAWDSLSPNFVKKVASFVYAVNVSDPMVASRALSILESVITNSTNPENVSIVQKGITVETLTKHIGSADSELQLNTLALLNGQLSRSSGSDRQEIYDQICRFQVRGAIFKSVLSKAVESDMAHQLYVFQTVSLSLLSARMQTRFDPNNKLHMVSLQALPQSAFPEEYGATQMRRPAIQGSGPGLSGAALWKKLGFVNSNPTQDFNEVPPGVLALECIVFFARNHLEECNKFLLDNLARRESHQCPFARSGIALTKMLCDIFRIGDAPLDVGGNYMPMFFSTDSFFEEVFSMCIQVLSKTWREMGASAVDFSKVIAMVKKQVTEVLKSKPRDVAEFKQGLWEMTYAKIISIIEEEKEKVEDVTTRARPVVELRDRIKPDIVELVKKQRLTHLVEGAVFPTFTPKGRTRGAFWFCRLSPNYRVLHWGNSDETTQSIPLESLQNKIPVSEIRELIIGKDCPHVKQSGKKVASNLVFSLSYEADSYMNFVSSDEKMYSIWVDGLRVLLNQPMMEQMARDDIEMLLNMDMKLRLLDVENAPIPDHPPKIPPDPPNLNFFYKDD